MLDFKSFIIFPRHCYLSCKIHVTANSYSEFLSNGILPRIKWTITVILLAMKTILIILNGGCEGRKYDLWLNWISINKEIILCNPMCIIDVNVFISSMEEFHSFLLFSYTHKQTDTDSHVHAVWIWVYEHLKSIVQVYAPKPAYEFWPEVIVSRIVQNSAINNNSVGFFI